MKCFNFLFKGGIMLLAVFTHNLSEGVSFIVMTVFFSTIALIILSGWAFFFFDENKERIKNFFSKIYSVLLKILNFSWDGIETISFVVLFFVVILLSFLQQMCKILRTILIFFTPV